MIGHSTTSRRGVLAALAVVLTLFGVALPASATPTGKKWPTLPVGYTVFPHASVNGVGNFQQAVIPVIQASFARWMGGAGTNFTCTNWRVQYGGTFTTPTGRAAIAPDGNNRVMWNGGAAWAGDANTLALTWVSSVPSTGQIVDADMEFNNNIVWKLGGNGAAYDIASVATHEAGHFLGLDHTNNRSAVMYFEVLLGDIKTALTAADISDVCTVYPAPPANPEPAPKLGQGAVCTTDSQCTSNACRGAVGGSSKICTTTCASSATCPTGLTCQTTSNGDQACLVRVGAADLCQFCTSGSDCSSGLCATDGRRNWCSQSCQADGDCGSGFKCVGDATGGKLCQPTADRCTAQCTSPSNCAVGYACVSGTCEATGKEGDRCEISEYCDSCLVCAGTKTAATCRPCCEAVAGDGLCAACPAKTCASGQSCSVVNAGKDKLCVEGDGRQVCQQCDASNPCSSGLTCVSGVCRASCNPQSPGTCAACLATGSGTGLCACSGEISFEGQACGNGANGLVACANGTVCVGSPSTCRAPCTPGAANACGTDEACLVVDNQSVCIPQQTPGNRCATCINGACGDGMTCVSGRCYEACDPQNPTCGSCVGVGLGQGLCACQDERSVEGGACGQILGKVQSCNPGLACLEGTCRGGCDPSRPECPLDSVCEQQGSLGYLCVPQGSTGTPGGGNGGGGNQTPGAGTGIDAGCGCGASGAAGGLWVAALVLGAIRRRRK